MPTKLSPRTLLRDETRLIEWLRTLPPRRVVTRDMGEPCGCLMAEFMHAHGYAKVLVGLYSIFVYPDTAVLSALGDPAGPSYEDFDMGPRLVKLVDAQFTTKAVTAGRVLRSAAKMFDD
jgi:hypothetical protein